MEHIGSLIKPVIDYWLLSDRFATVEGFLEPIEGYALDLLASIGPGCGAVLEVGSLYGRSTCYLAAGSKRNGRETVVAVDTFQGSPEHQAGQAAEQADIVREGSTFKTFLRNLARHDLADWVRPLKMTSEEAAAQWSGPIRLLFLDGDHAYEAVRRDCALWTPHLVKEGLLALHDVGTWPGVTRWHEELLAGGDWRETLNLGTLRVLHRAN